jgi:valyl-tRNA synthetase
MMQPTYDPAATEARWYVAWEEAGLFRPEIHPEGAPFSIVIPPPNVTGSLHMGHALDLTIQDVIIRRRRMQGYAALWLPGVDHAGIATQNVVERELAEEGLTRYDLGRERFMERVWAWKRKYGGRITEQIRRMGYSCDWSRERFTMDEGLSRAVREVFVRLYDEGLIYRGDRIINWCPRCRTALSDIEVIHDEVTGELVYIPYPFADRAGGITVATTRAETMLGDTAVAVHPDDPRYGDAVGRMLRLPLLGREIPVVADEAVDPGFGTGAVKVTPAHDINDFEIAERHGLPAVIIFDQAAAITEAGGRFAGMDRYVAREAVKAALAEDGALEKVEEHRYVLGRCERCETVVEPMLSRQWFVAVRPLSEPAITAVRDKQARLVPSRWEKSYFHWMENLRDWCISRQIWWGHRIPAWYCECGEVIVARDEPESCPACGSTELRQDEDVLDTWFSAALWPFSTLGWPEETQDLKTFYPTSVLVTGFDILYFWVARMLQMGLHFLDDVPFREVMLHGLVRDAEGRKMSKSLGNTVDPLEIVAEHGADPLRLALIQAATPGQDVPFQREWVVAARRFGNKVWNAVRFTLRHVEPGSIPAEGGYPEDPGPEGAWILARLRDTQDRFDALCDRYRFADAYSLLYQFAWSEVFDWYLEMAKIPLQDPERAGPARRTLGVVMRDLLKLLHPAVPFLTEELWSELSGRSLLAGARWPEPPAYRAPEEMETFQELVTGIRRFRAEHGLAPAEPLTVQIVDPEETAAPWWPEQLRGLADADFEFRKDPPAGSGFTRVVAGSVQGFIGLAGLVDLEAERERLARLIAECETELSRSQAKLANPDFVSRAPAEVVEKERGKVEELEERRAKLTAQLDELGGL